MPNTTIHDWGTFWVDIDRAGVGTNTVNTATATTQAVRDARLTEAIRVVRQRAGVNPVEPVRTAYVPTPLRALEEEPEWELEEEEEIRERPMPVRVGSVLDFKVNVGTRFGKRYKQKTKAEAVVGIEFENESTKDFTIDLQGGWEQHTEGSLRHVGVEFVLNPPQALEVAKKRVEELLEASRAAKVRWTNSIRTSIHVHFDVSRYLVQDVINFAAVYWILEDFLSDFAGEHRKQNLFCLRAKDARYQISDWTQSIFARTPYSFRSLDNSQRYGSVNLAALLKFGSFEFRMMRGTSSEKDIHLWLDTLEAIRQFALKFSTPLELREFFLKSVDAADFPKVVLGDRLFSELNFYRKNSEPLEESVREGFLNVESLLLSGGDWTFEKEIKEAQELAKRLKEHEEEQQRQFRAAQERQARINQTIYHINTFELEDNTPIHYRNTDTLVQHNIGDA